MKISRLPSRVSLSKSHRAIFQYEVQTQNNKEGILGLKALRQNVLNPHGKFRPTVAGPYTVKTILSGEAAQLFDIDDTEFDNLTIDQLMKFYV